MLREIAFLVSMLLFIVPVPGTGLRTSEFEDNALTFEIISPGNFSIDLPADARVLRAVMDLCPVPVDENGSAFLADPVLKIDDTVLWAFNGTGFGPFGRQCLFSDGSAEKTLEFGDNGGWGQASIRLPKGAVVEEALVDVDCSGDSWDWTDSPLGGPGKDAHFGYSIARAGDVNRDGFDDFLIGAPFHSLPGKSEVGMAGLYLGGPGFGGKPALFLTGKEAGERFGFSVSGAGDFNGDGYDDFLVGAPGEHHKSGENDSYIPGTVRLYLGGPIVDGVPDLLFEESTAPYDFGYSISSGGDLNNDGYDDVLVCSPHDAYPYMPIMNGLIYVYLGCNILDNYSDYRIDNHDYDIRAFTVEGAGDANHDGYDDFLVMFTEDSSIGRCGQVIPEYYWRSALCFGPTGNDKLIFAQDEKDPAYSFAGGGDLNADGYDDLLLGGVWGGKTKVREGLASIYLGNPRMDNKADIIIPSGGMAGGKVLEAARAGDVNGDGYDDAILGVGFGPLTEPSAPGKACVYFGGREFDTVPDLVFSGTVPMEFFGGVVASAGDVNADGRDEFLVASAGDDSGGRDSGTVHLFSLGYGLSGPRLEIGNIPFWESKTVSRARGAPQNFTSQLAAYLKTAPVAGRDRFGNEYVDVPVSVSARGGGNLTLSNIRIRYNCTVKIADFSAAANDCIDSHPEGEGANNSILINVECSSPALFCISNLDVEYGYGPSILQPIPDVVIDEESNNYRLLDLWDYFQDDVDPVDVLEFQVLEATNSDAVNVEVVLNRYLSAEAITGGASDNWTGEVRVMVGCSDLNGILRESNDFAIVVTNIQDPPVITSLPPTQASYGALYAYKVVAEDADGDVLHYYLGEWPDGMAIDWWNGEIRWLPQSRGKHDVHVWVTDGKDWASQNFTIDVWKNTPPVIQSEPPLKAVAGLQYEYYVMASDAEGDKLSICLRTTVQDMSIDSSTGRILWTPRQDQPGYYAVAIIVSDGLGETTDQAFILEVKDSRPGCRIMYPAEGAIVNGTFVFRGDAAGDAIPVVRVEARIDGGRWLPANGTDGWYFAQDTWLLGDGLHTFQARAFNGVYSDEARVSFVVKNRQSPAQEEYHIEGFPIQPLVMFLILMAVGVVLWRKESVGSRKGRS
jgi:hypothetical protein